MEMETLYKVSTKFIDEKVVNCRPNGNEIKCLKCGDEVKLVKEIILFCDNNKCSVHTVENTAFMTVDDKVVYPSDICRHCNKKMKRVIEPIGITIMKFDAMSPSAKREVLKKRSHVHFKKHIEEKARDIVKNSNPLKK
jgi:hypothetical protein